MSFGPTPVPTAIERCRALLDQVGDRRLAVAVLCALAPALAGRDDAEGLAVGTHHDDALLDAVLLGALLAHAPIQAPGTPAHSPEAVTRGR